jgi:hypothetical protein
MFGELLQAHIAVQIHKSVKQLSESFVIPGLEYSACWQHPTFLLCEMSMAGELECINKYFVILWTFSPSKAFR